MHVIDEPFCFCSDVIEDCEHFFFVCPLYNEQRQKLFNSLYVIFRECVINLHLLLFGSDNLSEENNNCVALHVQTFIQESGRFEM